MTNQNLIHPLLSHLVPVHKYPDCNDNEWNITHFSKSPCECCGTHLAGERVQVEAMRHSDRRSDNGIALLADTYEVCNDCVIKYQ